MDRYLGHSYPLAFSYSDRQPKLDRNREPDPDPDRFPGRHRQSDTIGDSRSVSVIQPVNDADSDTQC